MNNDEFSSVEELLSSAFRETTRCPGKPPGFNAGVMRAVRSLAQRDSGRYFFVTVFRSLAGGSCAAAACLAGYLLSWAPALEAKTLAAQAGSFFNGLALPY